MGNLNFIGISLLYKTEQLHIFNVKLYRCFQADLLLIKSTPAVISHTGKEECKSYKNIVMCLHAHAHLVTILTGISEFYLTSK